MFEVVTGEFRWHLQSEHRGPRGQSGHTWLNIFCGGWKREARQDDGVRVRRLRAVLQRKSLRVQEVSPSLYAIALARQSCEILKRLVIYLDFKRDALEHFSVTPDGLDDHGAFQLRNIPLALNVEGGSAEVA